ncbi:guanylate cyclase [Synergistales bacterium]|nr:guanylate cyclase [Synergistales bacterium]
MSLKKSVSSVFSANWALIAIAGAAATLIMLLMYVRAAPIITRMDSRIYDMMLPLRASKTPSDVPLIVDIDEKSIAEYGQWPWPRYLMASLVTELNRHEAAAIGFDIMFSERDNSSPKEMRDYLKRDKNFNVTFGGLPRNFYDFDKIFAESLKETPSVLGVYARFDDDAPVEIPRAPINIIEQAAPGVSASAGQFKLYHAPTAILPLPVLTEVASLGLINAYPDYDGVIRQAPLIISVGGKIFPSLALSSLMTALGVKNLTIGYGEDGTEFIRAGEFTVPVNSNGTINVPFIGGSGTYDYVSVSDVLKGEVDPDFLAGRVVFVGTSAAGLRDIRATPYDEIYPGVELHAAVVDAIITGNAITIPPSTPAIQALGILLAGLISTIVFGFARPRIYIPVAAALIASAIAASRHYFREGIYITPLYVAVTVIIVGVALLFLRFWHEEKQKVMLRKTFSRYISPEIVKRIMKERGDLFSGEERELSIIFTDIRGFTTLSEKLTPHQIVSLLNRYFTPMTAIVLDREGTLDKFIGDALMAFWNAPLDVPGHPALAVGAAVAMQERLNTLNEELEEEYGLSIRIGAGVHTGLAYVGNMGSADRVNYTLIGDNVNLASRLEGLCPKYGVKVVVSEDTMAACGEEFAWQFIDTISVKGKTQPVSIYTPMSRSDEFERADELARWKAACELYIAGDFAASETAFCSLCSDFPDSKLYDIYGERASQLRENPPENWNGVWVFTSK